MLEKVIVDCIVFKCYDNILNHSKLCGSKHIHHEPAQLNFACFDLRGTMKGVDLQKY